LLAPKGLVMEAQRDWSQGDHPVVLVSWDDARDFCAFVRGRLPTEAEWEYAARGGNAGRIYPWGNEYSPDQANGHGVGGKDRWNRSAPVESFPPNGYGLYDMGGNAWEWTSSVYADYPYRSDDGREDPGPAGPGWFAAGPGTTTRCTCERRPAASTRRPAASSTSVFAVPGTVPLDPCFLYLDPLRWTRHRRPQVRFQARSWSARPMTSSREASLGSRRRIVDGDRRGGSIRRCRPFTWRPASSATWRPGRAAT
jgi:hypothetical protein